MERFDRAVLSLLEAGPVPISRLVAELDEAGVLDFLREGGGDAAELEEAVRIELTEIEDVWKTPDGIVATFSRLADGLVLTHRVNADELEQGRVAVTPDLTALDYGVAGGLDLAGGGKLVYATGPQVPGESYSTFAGPDGWLDGFASGDLVAFRRSGRSVRVESVTAVAPGEDEVRLLEDTIDGRLPAGEGEEAAPLLLDALAHDPAAFRRPVRPLGELLGDAGLERRGFSFGRSGQRWQSVGDQHRAREDARLARKWHLDTCCTEAFRSARAAFDQFKTRAPADARLEDCRLIAEALAHSTVGPAFADRVLSTNMGGDDHLAAFAGQIVETVTGRIAAPAHLLLALDAERRGDAISAEVALRTARRLDPDYGSAAMELVVYEVDRGDTGRALKLLQHPEVSPESELLAFLRAFQASVDAPYRGVGRNERCPCGSGRKFKACCQDARSTVPLSQRIGLLARKLVMFVARDHRRPRLVGVATSACDPDADDFLERLLALTDGPVIADLVAFEGGGARDYLDERGALLPDDERELLGRLVDEPRRLWEVVESKPGKRAVLRSIDGGEPYEVSAENTGKGHAPGDLILARRLPLPGGEGGLFGFPLVIPPSLRDETLRLLDSHPDADAFATFLPRIL